MERRAPRAALSLRRRLGIGLSSAIIVGGSLATAIAFGLTFYEATDAQDIDLKQVAGAVMLQAVPVPVAPFVPLDNEDAETHYLIKPLGSSVTTDDTRLDVDLPRSLPPGLTTLVQGGEGWRVFVASDVNHRPFGVAQRIEVRDEVAMGGALLSLIPLMVLVPALLISAALVLRRTFEPLAQLSRQVDRIDGNNAVALNVDDVPQEMHAFAQAVSRLLERLALALEQQRRLVADAAHELRTPLAALLIQVGNVEGVELRSEARERLTLVRAGVKRLSSLVDQMLSLARIQGRLIPEMRKVPVGDYVRSAIATTLPLAQAKQIDLGCVRLDTVHVLADELNLGALIRNAIDNAVRYTPQGGTVDISVVQERGQATIVVEDTGPGIPIDERDRVMRPFVRLLGTGEAGAGLGLAIISAAATILGGTVELSERLDGRSGMRFVYRQPCVEIPAAHV